MPSARILKIVVIIRLAEQLPQLGLTDKLDELRMEALDFQIADLSDLPTSDVDAFWASVHQIKSLTINIINVYTFLQDKQRVKT